MRRVRLASPDAVIACAPPATQGYEVNQVFKLSLTTLEGVFLEQFVVGYEVTDDLDGVTYDLSLPLVRGELIRDIVGEMRRHAAQQGGAK
jgi:hypothetical protein